MHAHGAQVEDIGTRFDLHAYASDAVVTVAVAEGAVALGRDRSAVKNATWRQREAQHPAAPEGGGPRRKRTRLHHARGAGRDVAGLGGRQALVREPATAGGARNHGPLARIFDVRVPDTTLASRLVTAEFSTQSADEMIRGIAIAMDATVERQGRVVAFAPEIGAAPRQHSRSTAASAFFAALVAAAPAATYAQTSKAWSPGDVPRFLLVPADSTQPPAVVDPADVPILRRRIAVHVSGSTRREALQQIARASGLEFVYANDLMPPGDSVRLQADDITVAAALTEVLLGAGLDVAISANGNAILGEANGRCRTGAAEGCRARPRDDRQRHGDRRRGRHRDDGSDGRDIQDAHRFVGRLLDHDHRRHRRVPAVRQAAPGRKSFRQRLTRAGGDTTFVVNVKLASNVTTTMATVRVQARRPRPARSLGAEGQNGTDGTDRTVDGMFGARPPTCRGTWTRWRSSCPG